MVAGAHMKKAFWITTLGLAWMVWAIAQDVPPPPPLRGDAASLEDTMKFLQNKLPGKVNYVVYLHDNVAGADLPPIKRSFELSNVSADARGCSIRFHSRFDYGKSTDIRDMDDEILLRQVREIVLGQMDQVVQQAAAKSGHPERSAKIDPPIFLVRVRWVHGMMFNFYEETLADRVSKALQHAVDLCGGGNPEPF
jgi:hypothetical protein